MSDNHTGLPHDLPVRKVRVFKALNKRWYWGHACARGGYATGPVTPITPPVTGCATWTEAYLYGQAHARGCW